MRVALLLLALLFVLAGCTGNQNDAGVRPTPTIASFFSGADRPLPTIVIPTPVPRPTSADRPSTDEGVPILAATSQRDALDAVVEEVVIYDEELDPAWSTLYSFDHRVTLESTDTAASGVVSLRAIPQVAYGGTMLTLGEEGRKLFPRSEVLGLRFNVSGGPNQLRPLSLIVKLLGSNRYPYFVEGDNSVAFPPGLDTGAPVFSEVGLDRLGLRRELVPGEWAEVELWFDSYDQVDYTYITGLVVMNDRSYMNVFYIDDIRLLVRRP